MDVSFLVPDFLINVYCNEIENQVAQLRRNLSAAMVSYALIRLCTLYLAQRAYCTTPSRLNVEVQLQFKPVLYS